MSAALASRPGPRPRAGAPGHPGVDRGGLSRPASRVIPFWRDGCLVRDLAGPRPVVLGAQAAAAVLKHAALCVFLGLDDGPTSLPRTCRG